MFRIVTIYFRKHQFISFVAADRYEDFRKKFNNNINQVKQAIGEKNEKASGMKLKFKSSKQRIIKSQDFEHKKVFMLPNVS